jgi:hypothetical protein
VDEAAESGSPIFTVIAALAAVVAIVGLFTRPFLCEPIAALLILIAARQTSSRRWTMPVMLLIVVCFVVGAGIAAATSNPLY